MRMSARSRRDIVTRRPYSAAPRRRANCLESLSKTRRGHDSDKTPLAARQLKQCLSGFDETSFDGVANPMARLVRATARRLLDHLGLLGVAFRVQERLRAWTPVRHGVLDDEDGLP